MPWGQLRVAKRSRKKGRLMKGRAAVTSLMYDMVVAREPRLSSPGEERRRALALHWSSSSKGERT